MIAGWMTRGSSSGFGDGWPPYMRRSQEVAEVLPILQLHGSSTGDFRPALPVPLGESAELHRQPATLSFTLPLGESGRASSPQSPRTR